MSELINIGAITLKSLRNTILDLSLTSSNIIILHPNDFDDLALEYRDFYNESLFSPFVFIGVPVIPSDNNSVPLSRIKIDYDETSHILQSECYEESFPPFYTVYRCGWCGNVVAEEGSLLSNSTRAEHIRIIEKFGTEITHIKVNGMCCKDKW